jgi:hypothetical protein
MSTHPIARVQAFVLADVGLLRWSRSYLRVRLAPWEPNGKEIGS